MGKRAHGRRREGRAIRKYRRLIRRYTDAFGDVATTLRGMVPGFEAWAAAFAGLSAALGLPVNNHPSEGGQAVTEALSGSGRMQAAAEEMGVELMPWQIRVGEELLAGKQVAMAKGRKAGWSTLQKVVEHANKELTGEES